MALAICMVILVGLSGAVSATVRSIEDGTNIDEKTGAFDLPEVENPILLNKTIAQIEEWPKDIETKCFDLVYDDTGDWFDLSGNPISGAAFSDITHGAVIQHGNWLVFAVKVNDDIPYPTPPANMAYWFALDIDRNSNTGWTHILTNDIGVEYLLGAYYIDGWHFVVHDPIAGEDLVEIPYLVNGEILMVGIPAQYSPSSFDWLVYTWDWSTGNLVYDNAPNGGHSTFVKEPYANAHRYNNRNRGRN